MMRLIRLLFWKIMTLIDQGEMSGSALLQLAERKQLYGRLLLIWVFLVTFIFYPFSISVEAGTILKQGVFIIGGIFSLGIIFIGVLYNRVRINNKSLFGSLLAIAIVSMVSAILADRLENSVTGLFFELDTLAAISSFVAIIAASALAFRDWSGDLGLWLIKVIGIGIVLPAAVLLLSGSSYWQYLYIDGVSLQVFSVMVAITSAYLLDANRVQGLTVKFILASILLAALGTCLYSPHFILMALGLGLGTYLLYLRFHQRSEDKAFPISSIFLTLAFGVLLVVSFNQANQPQSILYLREIAFLGEALSYNFQWGETDRLWGMGPHTYNYFWDVYRPYASYYDDLWVADYEPPYIYNQPSYAFGLIPTNIINTGFLGLLAWLAFVISAAHLALRRLRRSAFEDQRSVSLALIVLLGLGAILVETPQITVLAILALALGALASKDLAVGNRLGARRAIRWLKLFSVMILIALLSLGLVFTKKIITTSLLVQKTADLWLSRSDSIGLPIFSIEEAIAKRPQPEYYRLLAQVQFYSARNYLLKTPTLGVEDNQNVRKLLGQSVFNASRAADLNKSDFRNWLILGDINSFIYIFGAEDADDLAAAHYNQVITLLNIQPMAYYGLARLAYLKDERDTALQNIEEALKFRPAWPEAEKLKAEIMSSQSTPIE